jgi:hypothetical protein
MHEMMNYVTHTAPLGLLVAAMVLALFVAIVWPFALILKKAGYSPGWGLLAVLPVAPLVMLYFIALANWPSLHKKNS